GLLAVMGRGDPLIGDALQTILDRGHFIRSLPDQGPGPAPAGGAPSPLDTDPAIVTELIGRSQASIAAVRRDIRTKSGSALLDFILADLLELKRILFDPRSHQVFMSAMEAAWWLNDQLQAWLGEKNGADTLTQSVLNNVTSEMGLALLDVADVIRRHPDVVAFLRLQHVEDEDFLDELPKLAGSLTRRAVATAASSSSRAPSAPLLMSVNPRYRSAYAIQRTSPSDSANTSASCPSCWAGPISA
ncbi:MAG: hypothetical protein ACR2IK_01750, partial [Chloroflexota bacterium]